MTSEEIAAAKETAKNNPTAYLARRLDNIPELEETTKQVYLSFTPERFFGLPVYDRRFIITHPELAEIQFKRLEESGLNIVWQLFNSSELFLNFILEKHPGVIDRFVQLPLNEFFNSLGSNVHLSFKVKQVMQPVIAQRIKELAAIRPDLYFRLNYDRDREFGKYITIALDHSVLSTAGQLHYDVVNAVSVSPFLTDAEKRRWLEKLSSFAEKKVEQIIRPSERPDFAKQYAKQLFDEGKTLFVHTGFSNELSNIKNTSGEVCVSSWDNTASLFTHFPVVLAALFEGRVSHMFKTDAFSEIGEFGMRITNLDETKLMEYDPKHPQDEGWFNPTAPGNKLVGFLVLGDPNDKKYPEYVKQAQQLAKINGVSYISMFGDPRKMEQVREKKPEQVDLPEEAIIQKYRGRPEMSEYANLQATLKKISESIPSISKYAKKSKEIIDSIVIKYVDGKEVREKEIDFCIGGHKYRYNFIPENEIWIEDVFKDRQDLTADLVHELVERTMMKFLKLDYSTAHDIANVTEKAVRKIEKDLSKRAAIERSSVGVSVSTSARKYWREYFSKHNLPNMALMPNKMLNDSLAGDFLKSKPLHRFLLKDASIGEFRKSNSFIYLAKLTNGMYTVLSIQPTYKETDPELSKRRLSKEWLDTGWKQLLERKTRPT